MSYDPQKAVAKQIRNAQAAAQDYADGVAKTNKNPMQRAKAKKNKMRNNFLSALDSGKWEAGLDAVSMQEWQNVTSTVGARNYPQGVADAQPKSQAFHDEFSSFMAGVQAKIDGMPDDTPEQRIQKMVENAKAISKFKRTRRRM